VGKSFAKWLLTSLVWPPKSLVETENIWNKSFILAVKYSFFKNWGLSQSSMTHGFVYNFFQQV